MAGRSSRRSDDGKIGEEFLEPGSLAVIGASSNPAKVGHAVLSNIIESKYPGDVFPVNPRGGEIRGLRCYSDVTKIPSTPDLAVIIVPAACVPDVVSQCAEKGVPYTVVISAGFREAGIEGRRLERDMVERARKGGMRVLGPNCLGMMNTSPPLNASFARLMPPNGSIGVLSQSGAICTSLLDWAREEGVGFSKLISLGNSADLVESDFLDFLSRDDETSVITMYLEGVSNGSRFFSSLSAATRRKPVVVFKAGTTEAGAQAASSHTGSLAGSERAYNAVCEQADALRAQSIEELVELSRALSTQGTSRGPRVGIITNAGGPGIVAADACEKCGLLLARLSTPTLETLRTELPRAASLHNPVDILGDADASRYGRAVEALAADKEVDNLLIILTPQAMTEVDKTADELIEHLANSKKTAVCSFMGAESVESAVSRLQRAGIPNVPYPDRAMHVLARMYERNLQVKRPKSHPIEFIVNSERVDEILESYGRKGLSQLGPEDCSAVLDAYGIPNVPFKVAPNFEAAKEFAEEMGYPVALKIVSPQILHKTDIGGVALDVKGRRELEESFEDIISRVRRRMPAAEIDGIGVQKMAPKGKELILGMVKDPQFGPMIMVGLGGIYVEAFRDVAFRLAPVGPEETARMLRELKAFRLLQGLRGEQPADVEAVEEVISRLSQLAVENPGISEMDINPLMVYNAGGGCTCVDVRMTLGG